MIKVKFLGHRSCAREGYQKRQQWLCATGDKTAACTRCTENSTNNEARQECGNVADDDTCNSLVLRGACNDTSSSTLTKFVREHCALACGFCTRTSATSVTTTLTTTNDNDLSDSGIYNVMQSLAYLRLTSLDELYTTYEL